MDLKAVFGDVDRFLRSVRFCGPPDIVFLTGLGVHQLDGESV